MFLLNDTALEFWMLPILLLTPVISFSILLLVLFHYSMFHSELFFLDSESRKHFPTFYF